MIASGGGGIPVYNNDSGNLEGLDAVIDKDYSAAKLGRIIRAQELWIITDVDNIYLKFGTDRQQKIDSINRNDLEELLINNEFLKGPIGPKIKAAIHFLKHHGEKVMITSIERIKDAMNHCAGTEIMN